MQPVRCISCKKRQMTTTYSYKRRRRGPKAGSTAIPFMITVLISLVVFGGVALYFYNKLTAKSKELQTMQSATTSISEDDVNSLLFVLDPDDDTKKTAVMMMRFDPVRKQIFCLGIPLDMQIVYDDKAMTVETCYINHGMDAMKDAISVLLDQPIDRYIKMDSTGFQKTVNLIGNVKYRIPVRDTGLRPMEDDMEVTLDNTQFETMLTSGNYSDEDERCSVIGTSVAQLLNQCIGGGEYSSLSDVTRKGEGGTRIAQNLDQYFDTMVNAVTTDITAMDFTNHRHAISYMFQYSSAPARGYYIICDRKEDGSVVPSEKGLANIKIALFQNVPKDSKDEPDGKAAEAEED